jgi:hypothetical protein
MQARVKGRGFWLTRVLPFGASGKPEGAHCSFEQQLGDLEAVVDAGSGAGYAFDGRSGACSLA